VPLEALEVAVEAVAVAEVITDIIYLILVLTLPIIPTITFMLKVAGEVVDKALAVTAALADPVIVLTLMVTIHHMVE
jgi:hypothetical protein